MLVSILANILVCSVHVCDTFSMRLLFQMVFMGMFIVPPNSL